MDPWFRQLGFFNNPLSIKPAAFHSELFGYDGIISETFEKIRDGEVLFIEGEYGFGKTSLLKKIIRAFGGRKKLIYYSCNRKEYDLDIDELLKGVYGFWGRLFGRRGKNMVMLLDEAQELDEDDFDNLIENYENGNLKSVVLVSSDANKVRFTPNFKKLIDKNIIKLKKVDNNAAVDLVRKRIGYISVIPDEMITKIYKKSDYNPRKFLRNTEEVLKYVVDNSEDAVTDEHVKKVLG